MALSLTHYRTPRLLCQRRDQPLEVGTAGQHGQRGSPRDIVDFATALARALAPLDRLAQQGHGNVLVGLSLVAAAARELRIDAGDIVQDQEVV